MKEILKSNNYLFPAEGGKYLSDITIDNTDKYVVLEVTNNDDISIPVFISFWCGDNEPQLQIKCGILPKIKTQVAFPLDIIDGNKLFLPLEGIRMKSIIVGLRAERNKVTKIGIMTDKHPSEANLTIHSFYIADKYTFEEIPKEKLVDKYGQWTAKDWPGKVSSYEEIKEYIDHELDKANDCNTTSGIAPYEGTGFFRVEKVENRFIMISPEGYPFFSSGIDSIGNSVDNRIEGIEEFFEYLPDANDDEVSFIRTIHGNPPLKCVSFVRNNLKKNYGDDWENIWRKYVTYKMKDWGFNTVAAWSDENFIKYSKLPYTLFLRDYPRTERCIYRDFPDVFSDEYKDNAKAYAQQILPYKDDSMLLGYFMSNEPNFGFAPKLNIAHELITNPLPLKSKTILIDFFKERYGSIEKLNEVWRTEFNTFAALSELTREFNFSDEALSELDEFSKVLMREYVRVPAMELKALDPNHLNLGMRFAWVSTPSMYACAEFMDIFSINCYSISCCDDVNEVYKNTGKPVIIGEYHFGSTDRGLPATGIKAGKTQEQRGVAIRYYLENAMSNPYCVGAHYFQLYDQGILGRPDGENYNIGLLDVCSKEHKEVADVFRDVHSKCTDLMFGRIEPTTIQAEKVPAVYY